ncbi:hypothetical protein ONZ45_g11052 [Pleurotus djamor]|nr:hypothetical protein ONZ45_g11052 [Pleurotus djamor]
MCTPPQTWSIVDPQLDFVCSPRVSPVDLDLKGATLSPPLSELKQWDLAEPELDQSSDATPSNSRSYIQSSYVFEDGDLGILVDEVFYRIHSHFIDIHSPSLRDRCDTMNIAKSEDTLVLTLVSSEGFSDVLWIFYDETLELVASPEKWLSILLTAEKLQMAKVVNLAIANLNRSTPPVADPISIIIAQHRHHIREAWADTAYLEICRRDDSLNKTEVKLLGPGLTAMVSKAREAALKASPRRTRQAILDVFSEFGERTGPCRGLMYEPLPKDRPYEVNVRTGELYIGVGKSIFAIHRHFLLTQAPGLARLLESNTDEKEPASFIRLKGVNEIHFSWFLWVLYDRPFTPALTADTEQWTAIYSIAKKFDMVHVERLALMQIKDLLTPAERLAHAAQFNISGDLFDEAMELMCSRRSPPTKDEVRHLLDNNLLMKICQEREQRLRHEVSRLTEREASLVEELAMWEECTGCLGKTGLGKKKKGKRVPKPRPEVVVDP